MSWDHLDLSMARTDEIRCRHTFRPTIKEFGHKTHFSKVELESLLIIHYKLTKKQPMDRRYFRIVMYKLFDFQNSILIDRIFSAFDLHNRLVITMESWILGLSVILRGTLEEKVRFCFKVYDWLGEGFLKRDIMFQYLKNTYKGYPGIEEPEDLVRDLIDVMMKKMDLDRDGVISFEEYRESVFKNPDLLEFLGYCLPARPAVYAFMDTFTQNVTTLHAQMMKRSN